jgi:hypothetical protein
MKLVQFTDPADGLHVGVVDGDEVVDLAAGGASSLHDIYYKCGGDRDGFATAAAKVMQAAAGGRRVALAALVAGDGGLRLDKPISGPAGDPHALRVWLAGVTHEDSAKLREIEAQQATGDAVNVYDQKYRECAKGGRPELFSKNDPDAVVGSGVSVSRPADTARLVPETELVSVYGLNREGQVELLGFTGGNDVTDNGIEAANPLNLPQAKNWSGGCASLGPVLVTADAYDDAEVTVSCEILRQGQRVAFKEGLTGQRHLNMPDKRLHLERTLFNRVPLLPGQLQAFYWGTPIVFSEGDFPGGLLEGDLMRLHFSGGIGTLENSVVAQEDVGQLDGLAR